MKSDNLYKSSLASATLTEGAEQLKERLGAIMHFKKESKTIKAATMIFTAAICIGYIAIGAYAAPSAVNDNAAWKAVMEAAEKIDRNGSYEYPYIQDGYYCNSYIIEMGWNLYAKDQDYYAAIEIVLEDKSKMTVCFSDSAKDYMRDSGAVSAIEELIYSLKNENMSPAIEMPLVVSITPVSTDDIPALAEKYFQNEDLIRFSALFSVLDEAAQRNYCQKAYNTDKIALFSTIVQDMDADFILQYIDKTEQDNKINFFAVLSDHMQSSDLKHYAGKYYETDNIARFAILLDGMSKEEKQEWQKRAQTDKKANFAAVLSDKLPD